MRPLRPLLLSILSLAVATSAQQSVSATSPAAAPAQVQAASPERAQIEELFKKYEAAYQHLSLYELQSIWPDLPNQKKDYRKAEEMFRRGDVADMKVSIQIENVRPQNNAAIVRCKRREEYRQTWHSTDATGTPHTATGFTPIDEKHQSKVITNHEIEFTLQRSGNGYVIASPADKGKVKPTPN